MADKKAKSLHDDQWWAEQRAAYIAKNDYIFGHPKEWQPIAPEEFYRIIFPEGSLQKAGEEIPWNEPGGGVPNGIIIQITHKKRKSTTKTGKQREYSVVQRYVLTDDLRQVRERIDDSDAKNEQVFCAPVSYFGNHRTAKNARFLHAFAIDLDGVGLQETMNMLKQFRNGTNPKIAYCAVLPQPTFIVNSGTGFHLYYVLEQPIPLLPKIVPFLQEMKTRLTDYVWRDGITYLDEVQHQGIFQAFRMPGTPTKLNGKTATSKKKDRYEAVAFVHYGKDGKPWRCSIEYLLDFAAAKCRAKGLEELLELMKTSGRTPIESAKKLWPEWYQARIVEGKAPGRWTCKRDLYDWWIEEIRTKATDHHRYWCLNALAAYAVKCDIPYDELEEDALALVPTLETFTKRADNHFTEEDALAAISAYNDPLIYKLTRERIARRTAIDLPCNKRNGRSQKQHIAVMNAVRDVDYPDGDWRNKDGAPTKADLVRDYALAHPEANHSEIARALGVSRPTVIKWLKPVPEDPENESNRQAVSELLAKLLS